MAIVCVWAKVVTFKVVGRKFARSTAFCAMEVIHGRTDEVCFCTIILGNILHTDPNYLSISARFLKSHFLSIIVELNLYLVPRRKTASYLILTWILRSGSSILFA